MLVLALLILPFLPNTTIDPWHLLNPRNFGLLLLVILGMQFLGYAAMRLFGTHRGILLSGFLTGFISSTTTTATLSQQVRKKAIPDTAGAAAVLLATVSMLIQVFIIVAVASPSLVSIIAKPLLVAIFTGVILALIVGRKATLKDHIPLPHNPLALWAALRLTGILATMFIIIALAKQFFGASGTQIVSFFGGLAETRGITLALSTLHEQNQLSGLQASASIGLAISASFITKFGILWTTARGRFALITTGLLLLMLSVIIISGFYFYDQPIIVRIP